MSTGFFGSQFTPAQIEKLKHRISEVHVYIDGMNNIVNQYDWDNATPKMVQELRGRLQESCRIIQGELTRSLRQW